MAGVSLTSCNTIFWRSNHRVSIWINAKKVRFLTDIFEFFGREEDFGLVSEGLLPRIGVVLAKEQRIGETPKLEILVSVGGRYVFWVCGILKEFITMVAKWVDPQVCRQNSRERQFET
jgi:hypothetical protein